MAAVLSQGNPRRDPAWRARVTGLLVACVLLWPLLVWTEFRPWQLLSPESLKQKAQKQAINSVGEVKHARRS